MAASVANSSAEASGPAAGYYYQVRYALLIALERLRRHPTASVSIEKLEDVAIEYQSGVVDLEQLKHSLDSGKVYHDADKAVWRTLGNWVRLYRHNSAHMVGTRLFLTTNGKAAASSALSKLGVDRTDTDLEEATTALLTIAAASANKDTAQDREDFRDLSAPIRATLMASIIFVEDSPGLAALADELEDLIAFACISEERSRFRNELEGWWFDRVMRDWSKGAGATVPLVELEARLAFLRERYKAANLVIDVDDQIALEPLDGRNLIEQAKLVKVGAGRLQNVQRNYLKASAQRSKWLREFKIDPAELLAYDNSLAERWDTRSEILKDEIESGADDEAKCAAGRKLLAWAEELEIPIRSARAQFLTGGSYHALADRLRVGWHPDFKLHFQR